jgi:hypothetical protein
MIMDKNNKSMKILINENQFKKLIDLIVNEQISFSKDSNISKNEVLIMIETISQGF